MTKEVIVIEAKEGSKRNKKNDLLRTCAYCRVSTDLEEQLTSYETQISYYSKLIQENPKYEFVGIYADRGITGTQTKNRDEFNRMIDDAKLGKIDLIIAKSISRFARNTLDTLNNVRLLKEHKVDVYFEKENLHTLSMTSEMLLTLMSAFAQAESESISENVTMGIRARMKSGDYIGSGNRCFGYHIDVKNNIFEIKEEEAKVVRKIFALYLEGNGYRRIANQLNEENIPSPTGIKWRDSSVQNILQNEKYCGDVIVQKTYTVDVLSHKRTMNYGEKKKYKTENHHEAIICREDWDLVQQIMRERAKSSEYNMHDTKHSRRYTFSSKISCGKCGKNYERQIKRRKKGDVIYWRCYARWDDYNYKCKSLSIRESILEDLFVRIYNFLIKEVNYEGKNIAELIEDFLQKNSNQEIIDKLHREYVDTQTKLSNLIEIKIDDLCHKETYELKELELTSRLNEIQQKLSSFNESEKTLHLLKKRLNEINKVIQTSTIITKFDKVLFEKMIGKILIGDVDSNNVIRFILNDNLSSSVYIYPSKDMKKTGLPSTNEGCHIDKPIHNSNIVDILEFKAKIKDGKMKMFYYSRPNLSNLDNIYTIYLSIKK